MHFDDRLATVLNTPVTGENAARTQYRQLLDLLGRLPGNARAPLVEAGFARLQALAESIPVEQRAAILRDPALRIENPRLLTLLGGAEPQVVMAAMASARLADRQWERLIPRLPIRARGLLRHRRDLGAGPTRLLAQLGVTDLVLPGPEPANDSAQPTVEPARPPAPLRPALREQEEIGTLLRRIEAFRKSREATPPSRSGGEAPRLPLEERPTAQTGLQLDSLDFATDAAGRVTWADPVAAPMIVGTLMPALLKGRVAPIAMQRHLPLMDARLTLDGAVAIAGEWRIDAAPRFADHGGRFTGYCGRLRRAPAPLLSAEDSEAQRIREMLHELRTPVNAIQGFAEIIQQQLFGATPHEYRALAASIAADAAKLLAGFDELDRLARLESGALELDPGSCDFAAQLRRTAGQLEPYLGSRKADFVFESPRTPLRRVALAPADAEKLAWRLLATLASATTPGEDMALVVEDGDDAQRISIELPVSYAGQSDIFTASAPAGTQVLSAGMFGAGFSMRLARAEARAAGGDLVREGENLALTLRHYRDTFADDGEAAA